jgi:hypothetical protein
MRDNNIQIGFGVPQGGILVGGGKTIVDFEIFFSCLLPKCPDVGTHQSNGFQLFKPLDFIAPNPRINKKKGIENSEKTLTSFFVF